MHLPSCSSPRSYVVGSGNTGAAGALLVCSAIYATTMLSCALTLRRPHPSYTPPGAPAVAAASDDKDGAPAAAPAVMATGNVPLSAVARTPQFWGMGTVFFCLASGGMGIFSVAKPMMNEVFASSLPGLVTGAFAGMYVHPPHHPRARDTPSCSY